VLAHSSPRSQHRCPRKWATSAARTANPAPAALPVLLALATVLALMTAMVGAFTGAAPAALAAHRPPRPGGHAGPGSGLTLAQAPAGLRAAVRRTLGAPATPAASTFQQAKLTAADGAENDFFGNSVAISGSTALVGAPHKNSETGAAYVFTGSGSIWSRQAELSASDTSDGFGWSMALAMPTAVVGAPDGKHLETGAAYVFVKV
jgi:FG-GAP repeat